MRLIGTILIMAALASPAWGQDRTDISEWFRSLKVPNPINGLPAGASCCSEADCRQREVRWNGFIEEAWIEEANRWAVIPLEAKITDPDVLAKRPLFGRVICFIPAYGTVCDVDGQAGG